MKYSLTIKRILALFLEHVGVVRWKIEKAVKNEFLILMYHRVISRNEAKKGGQAGMYVEPETFEIHIRFLQKYFYIAPISQISFNSKGDFEGPNNKPVCVLSFDDGWYDFYKHAFPILKKHGVPATIFLPTDFIGTRRWFWTDRLSYLFSLREKLKGLGRPSQSSKNDVLNRLEKLKGSQEYRLEKAIEMLKALRGEDIDDILSKLSLSFNLDQNIPGRAFLSWEEVRDMAQSGLISYGSHTASHRILTTLSDEEIQDDLLRSKEKLIAEKAVDPSFIPFSYPNGNYNEKIAGMVKEAGYDLAVTTNNGWNHPRSDPFTLRRIGIHQDMTSTNAMLGCRITNIF